MTVSSNSSIKGDFKKYDIVEYKVNNYVGMSASAVSQVLSENGIDVKQEIVINEVYPAGFVIKQSVEEGKKLLQGESITLSVAAREGSIILEDFSGQSFQHVGTTLETQEIIVKYKELNSAKFADGKIIRTSPGVGSIIEKGDTIVIYYSTGKLNKSVTVPNLKGMTLEEAQQALTRQDVGLKVGVVYPSPSAEIDHLFPTPTPTEEPTKEPTETTSTPEATDSEQTGFPSDEIVPLTEEENTPDIGNETSKVTPKPDQTEGPADGTPDDGNLPSDQHVYAHDKVVSQYPPAGTQLMIGETVNIYFYDLSDILPKKELTMALPTVTPTPTPTPTIAPTGEETTAEPTLTPTPTPTATLTPTPTLDPNETIGPTINPDSLIKGNACSIRIEAFVDGMNNTRRIVYMSPSLDLLKFPIKYEVPLSLTGAPTKVYIYIGEVGESPSLHKVINVYG